MKTAVKITLINSGSHRINSYPTEKEALQYFNEKCDELGYIAKDNEAGGIGYDYRIELLEE